MGRIFNQALVSTFLLWVLLSSFIVGLAEAKLISDDEDFLITLHGRFLSADKLEQFKHKLGEKRSLARGGGVGVGVGGGGGGGGGGSSGMMGGGGAAGGIAGAGLRGGGDGLTSSEQQTIQNLFVNHELIDRNVTELYDEETGDLMGINSVTTSADETVASQLQKHVTEMEKLVHEDGRNVRTWDPLYAELLGHRMETDMIVNNITNGIVVELLGDDKCAAYLLSAHAEAVSLFAESGTEEAQQRHELPTTYVNECP
jgi:hypothetical protein